MPEVIASFACVGRRSTFSVARGDAVDIATDVAVIGKAPELRRRLERAGAMFEPFGGNWNCFMGHLRGRVRRAVMPSPRAGNWARVFAVDYRPRHNRLEFGPPLYGVLSHPGMLAFSLSSMLHQETYQAPFARCLFIPLSWRNPDVVCAASVAACYGFAALLEPYHVTAGCEFVLCDYSDPTPFLHFLRNEGDRFARFMGQTGLAGTRYYQANPIREIPAVPLGR